MVHSSAERRSVDNWGMTKTRRIIASLTLAATPALMVGCTGAEVQDFFNSQGHPVSAETPERIAKVVTYLEDKADRHCGSTSTSTTTTTEAPTTTAAVKASYRHGCGDGTGHHSGFTSGRSKSRHSH